MVISELFSVLAGIKDGDWVHVRRVAEFACRLQSVILVPLSKNSLPNSHELKQSLLREAHVVSQGSAVLIPAPASNVSSSKSNGPGAHNFPLEAFFVLHTAPLLQGTLGKDAVVTVVPLESVLHSMNEESTLPNGTSSHQSGPGLPVPKLAEPKNHITRLRDVIERFQGRANGAVFNLTASELASSSFNGSSFGRSPSRKPLLVSSFMNLISPTLGGSKSPNPRTPGSPGVGQAVVSKLVAKQLSHPFRSVQPPPTDRDFPLECGVSLATLKSLHIFSGSYVLICTESTAARHIGRLYALPSSVDFDDNVIYLSPDLTFNLGLDLTRSTNHVTVRDVSGSVSRVVSGSGSLPVPIGSTQTTPRGSPSKLPSTPSLLSAFASSASGAPAFPPPAFATEAYISRVRSPSSSGHAFYRKALQDHFSQPRLFKPGDLFTVIVRRKRFLCAATADGVDFEEDDDVDDDEEDAEPEGDSPSLARKHIPMTQGAAEDPIFELVYFKLAKVSVGDNATLDPEFVWIDKNRTTLYQEGAVGSRIPTSVDTFFLKSPSLRPASAPAGMSVIFSQLQSALRPCLHPMSPQLGLNVSLLLHGRAGSGKRTVLRSLASALGIHLFEVNCFSLIGSADTQTESKLRATFKTAVEMVPCMLVLRNVDAFEYSASAQERQEPAIAAAIKDLIQSTVDVIRSHKEPLIVVGTTSNIVRVSKTIRACYRQEASIEMPDEKQRYEIIQEATSQLIVDRDVSLRDLALRTASFSPRDLITLGNHASTFALSRIVETCSQQDKTAPLPFDEMAFVQNDLCAAGVVVSADDFERAIHVLQQQHSASLGTPKIPSVKWEDVGGLMDAKREILDTIQLPLQHPELFGAGMRTRSGILLFGPPGTGKTLLAKAIATECNLNFISVKGPELINMYVGESEKNVRAVFQKARDARPCVIFFDELDSLAPNRGRNGDSGGVMDRIVSQLLAELSAMTSGANDVFVIGATNRPDLIDPALLVPGRFDKLIYLGVNTDQKSRENVRFSILSALEAHIFFEKQIISAQTRKFKLGPSVNIPDLASACPGNLTGADLYALCSDALVVAIRDRVSSMEQLDKKEIEEMKKQDTSVDVLVEQNHFLEALKKLTPSVSFEELERYQQLAAKFTKTGSSEKK